MIVGMYGFWLPNDERGSWSDFVGSWESLHFGKATTVRVRASLARRPFDRAKRAAALAALKYPPVVLTGLQARAIGTGFGEYAHKAGLSILACAILPKHVHLVLARHRLHAEQLVNQLKGVATRRLIEEQIHPLAGGCHGWLVHPCAALLGKPAVAPQAATAIRKTLKRGGK